MNISSSVHCHLHSGPIKPASWVIWTANSQNYAATAYLAGVKSASTMLLAFNLFCPLITENSSRTRNMFPPNALSNPKRPHEICCWGHCSCGVCECKLLRRFRSVRLLVSAFAEPTPRTPADAFQNVPIKIK